nr:hypothetical protein [Tanacetum cinerariifolium]
AGVLAQQGHLTDFGVGQGQQVHFGPEIVAPDGRHDAVGVGAGRGGGAAVGDAHPVIEGVVGHHRDFPPANVVVAVVFVAQLNVALVADKVAGRALADARRD